MNTYQVIEEENHLRDMYLGAEGGVCLPPLFLPLPIEEISVENTQNK